MKKTNHAIFSMFVLISIVMSGCIPTPTLFVATITPFPSNTPTPTETAKPTETVTPTTTPVPPTATATMTVVPKPELKPLFVQEVNKKYKGVQIHTKIITDETLYMSAFPIKKITIQEDVTIQFIASTVFRVWWAKGNVENKTLPTEKDFLAFMDLWAAAQNGKGTWEDVQFKIYANDLATPGYNQDLVTIWPMFTGNAIIPDGVNAIKEMNIVYIIGERSKSRTIISDVWGDGFGSNLNGDALDIFVIPISTLSGNNANPAPRSNHNFSGITSCIPWYLINNPGRSNWHATPKAERKFYNLLLLGLRGYNDNGVQSW